MKKEWFIAGAAILAGYAVYRYFAAPDINSSLKTIKSTSDSYRYPTEEEKGRGWAAGDSKIISQVGNTTYFWSEKDLEDMNFAQRFLLNVGVPSEWVLQ